MNNNSKYDFVNYIIHTDKLKKGEERKVVLIADLHNYFKNSKKINELAININNSKPHHIIISGDIMQGKKWINKKQYLLFSKFLEIISKNTPVFIVLGNHDLACINEKTKLKVIDNFKKLKEIRPKMIYPLLNEKVSYEDFEIYGYFQKNQSLSNLDIQEHGLAHDLFIKEYNKDSIKFNNKKIIEFIIHNPNLIGCSENKICLGQLSEVDTFYSGHLHNGYRKSTTIKNNPNKYLDKGYVERLYSRDRNGKIIKKSLNLLLFSKTSLCRGTIYIDDYSKRIILQLRNNQYFINNSNETKKTDWINISEIEARNIIKSKKLHALVITGGISKFFGFNLYKDYPEITEIIYKGDN